MKALLTVNAALLLAAIFLLVNQDQRDRAFRRLGEIPERDGESYPVSYSPEDAGDEAAFREAGREEAARRGYRDADEPERPRNWQYFRFRRVDPRPGDPPGTKRFEPVPIDPPGPTPQKPLTEA